MSAAWLMAPDLETRLRGFIEKVFGEFNPNSLKFHSAALIFRRCKLHENGV